MPVQEALDLRGRQRADELVDDLAVLERLHGRDRLDAERLGHARVGVRVDLDELDLAVALVDGLLDHRAERAARAAPLGPEVDDDGLLEGALDDVALEGGCQWRRWARCEDRAMDLQIDADGVTLAGEEAGEGSPGRAAARADGDAPLRRDGLEGARARRAPRGAYDARAHGQSDRRTEDYGYDRLADGPARRARRPRHRAGRRWPAPRWARTRSRSSRSRTPTASPALVIMTPAYDPERDARPGPLGPARQGPARGRRRGLRRGLRHAERAREVARDDRPRPAPAALRPRAPRRAGRRARRPCRAHARSRPGSDLARHRRADRDRRQPRRGRPRAPVRGRASATPRRSRTRAWSPRSEGDSPLAWQGAQVSKVIARWRRCGSRAMSSSAHSTTSSRS